METLLASFNSRPLQTTSAAPRSVRGPYPPSVSTCHLSYPGPSSSTAPCHVAHLLPPVLPFILQIRNWAALGSSWIPWPSPAPRSSPSQRRAAAAEAPRRSRGGDGNEWLATCRLLPIHPSIHGEKPLVKHLLSSHPRARGRTYMHVPLTGATTEAITRSNSLTRILTPSIVPADN